jgi:hypothetical protein
MGTFHGMRLDAGCPLFVLNVQFEEYILIVAERQPSRNTWSLLGRTGTFDASAHRPLQEQQLYPYLIESVQELYHTVHLQDVHSANGAWLVGRRLYTDSKGRIVPHCNWDSHLVMSLWWGSTPRQSDWLTVSRKVILALTFGTGINNIHNERVKSGENSHAIRSYHQQQQQFSVNVWLEF